jgi:hypothetical protein
MASSGLMTLRIAIFLSIEGATRGTDFARNPSSELTQALCMLAFVDGLIFCLLAFYPGMAEAFGDFHWREWI